MLHLIWTPFKLNIASEWLGGGFKCFYFQPYLGKWSNLTNIFHMGWNPPPRWRRLDSDYYLFRQPNPEAMKDEIQTVLPPRMTVTWKTRGNVSNPWDFGKHADVPSRELTYIIPHQTGSSEFSPSKRPGLEGEMWSETGNPGGLLLWKFLNSFTFPISSNTSEFFGKSGLEKRVASESMSENWNPPIVENELGVHHLRFSEWKNPEIVDVFSFAEGIRYQSASKEFG